MTKRQEEELLRDVDNLKKQLHKLLLKAENNQLEKNVYTVAETADMLNRTVQSVYAMIHRGELEAVKLGTIMVVGDSLRSKLKGEIR